MADMAFGKAGNCYILVHNRNVPPDGEWEPWVAFLQEGLGFSHDLLRALIVTAGGAPTANQRSALNKMMANTPGTLTAVVTDSRVARLVVTTLGLFNQKIRAFAPDHLAEALNYLQLSSFTQGGVINLAKQLHEQLGLSLRAP